MLGWNKTALPTPAQALPGRQEPLNVADTHAVLGTNIKPPFPDHCAQVQFGLGCFWGAERLFWQLPGIYTTAVGYAGGQTPNPNYKEVCTGLTGHTEVVLLVFNPEEAPFTLLLKTFWEAHDPTQGMRQGNDLGTQYRSAIYTYDDDQLAQAKLSRDQFQTELGKKSFGKITTEITSACNFYYAETEHQQYLDKNPGGYCGLKGTGACFT